MKRLITFLAISLLLAGCYIFEDEDRRTYFKAEGVGYVYNKYTKEPISNVIIHVHSAFEHGRFGATVQIEPECFSADEKGYFCVKFLKRTQRSHVVGYSITAFDTNYSLTIPAVSFSVDKIKEINTINLDTLWIQY